MPTCVNCKTTFTQDDPAKIPCSDDGIFFFCDKDCKDKLRNKPSFGSAFFLAIFGIPHLPTWSVISQNASWRRDLVVRMIKVYGAGDLRSTPTAAFTN
jgi:hypothetical protein